MMKAQFEIWPQRWGEIPKGAEDPHINWQVRQAAACSVLLNTPDGTTELESQPSSGPRPIGEAVIKVNTLSHPKVQRD